MKLIFFVLLSVVSHISFAEEVKPSAKIAEKRDSTAKSADKPAEKVACDPKKSVCEEPNPEMYKKFEAYQDRLDKKFEAYKQVRGDKLKAAGWKEIARCDDGHTWSYVLEKGGDQLKCEGINALAGPEEHPCVPFTEDMDAFKKNADKAKAYVAEYDKASKAKNIEKFLAKKTKENSIPNCW